MTHSAQASEAGRVRPTVFLLLALVIPVDCFSVLALVTFGTGLFFVLGAMLCTVGCGAASLVSSHEMPVAPLPPSHDCRKYLQTCTCAPLSGGPPRGTCSL